MTYARKVFDRTSIDDTHILRHCMASLQDESFSLGPECLDRLQSRGTDDGIAIGSLVVLIACRLRTFARFTSEMPTLSNASRPLGATCHAERPCARHPKPVGRAFVHNHHAASTIRRQRNRNLPLARPHNAQPRTIDLTEMLRRQHGSGWASSEHPTAIEKERAVDEQRGQEEVVADHDDSDAFGRDFAQESIQVKLMGDIQVRRWLIKQQVRAELSQGASYYDALAFTATELSEGTIGQPVHTNTLQAASHQFAINYTITSPALSMSIPSQLDDLTGGERRVGRSILRHDGDVCCHFVGGHSTRLITAISRSPACGSLNLPAQAYQPAGGGSDVLL